MELPDGGIIGVICDLPGKRHSQWSSKYKIGLVAQIQHHIAIGCPEEISPDMEFQGFPNTGIKFIYPSRNVLISISNSLGNFKTRTRHLTLIKTVIGFPRRHSSDHQPSHGISQRCGTERIGTHIDIADRIYRRNTNYFR